MSEIDLDEFYVSRLTMVEDKVSGELQVKLEFSDMDYDEDDAPVSYDIMSALAENYLVLTSGHGTGDDDEIVTIN